MRNKIMKLDKRLIEAPGILVFTTVVYLCLIFLLMSSIEVTNSTGLTESLWNRVVEQVITGDGK